MKYRLTSCAAFICVVVLVSCTALYAIDDQQEVEISFQNFSQQWMQHHYNREKKANLVCKKVKDSFVAEYTGYSRSYSSRTKRTEYKETPYIGILSYQELKFVSKAGTYEEAINGTFMLLQECPVTEIFSFSGGTWRY